RLLAGARQGGPPVGVAHLRGGVARELPHHPREVGSLDELHGVEPPVAVGAGGEDLDEVRVLHAAEGADLAGEARLDLGVAGAEEALERHLPAERWLPGAVDHAHAAASDASQELELADAPSRGYRPGVDAAGGVRRALLDAAPVRPPLERALVH